jgi:hypothetical protein
MPTTVRAWEAIPAHGDRVTTAQLCASPCRTCVPLFSRPGADRAAVQAMRMEWPPGPKGCQRRRQGVLHHSSGRRNCWPVYPSSGSGSAMHSSDEESRNLDDLPEEFLAQLRCGDGPRPRAIADVLWTNWPCCASRIPTSRPTRSGLAPTPMPSPIFLPVALVCPKPAPPESGPGTPSEHSGERPGAALCGRASPAIRANPRQTPQPEVPQRLSRA